MKKLVFVIAAALLAMAARQHAVAGSATWSTNPSDGDWNTAFNWVPETVPNGAPDIATFGTSNVTNLSINTTAVEVDSIVFNTAANPFTITVDSGNGIVNLFLTGVGVVNQSGTVQSLNGGGQAGIFLANNATAGTLTSFGGGGAQFFFTESASAGSASFVVNSVGTYQAHMEFFDGATAADATITASNFAQVSLNDNATAANAVITLTTGAFVIFGTSSSADNAFVACIGGNGIYGSNVDFQQSATAGQGQFTAVGASTVGESGSFIEFRDSTTAADQVVCYPGRPCA